MKKYMKKAVAAVLTIIMVLSFAACNQAATPEQKLAEGMKKMAEAKSMSYDMDIAMTLSTSGINLDMGIKGNYKTINDPVTVEGEMTMEMGFLGSVTTKVYAEKVDEKYYVYSGTDAGGEGKYTWTKTEVDAAGMAQYSPQDTFDMYIKYLKNTQEKEAEDINGTKATRYDAVIPNEYLSEVMESNGILEQFTGVAPDGLDLAELFKDLGDIPISVWLNADGYPAKYEMDMTTMMQTMMAKIGESQGASIDVSKVSISMIITGIDTVDTITIPDEAKNAA